MVGKRFTYFRGFGTIPNSGEIDRKKTSKQGAKMGRRKKVVPRQRNVRGGGWLEWRNGQWLARYVRNGKKLSKMTGTADKAVAE